MSITAFFNMIKVLGIAIAIISVALLGYSLYDTQKELLAKKTELVVVSSKLEEQNKAIESLKLDITKYKNQKPKVIEKIVTKYNEIKVKDDTCESYLEAIYNTQVEFFNRNNRKGQTK